METRAATSAKPQASFGGRWTYVVIFIALMFVLMPFLFWNATWFGRPLTDDQITKALADRSHPREIQHVLAQLETRIEMRDTSVQKWYPQIVALANHPVDEIRVTDAWVMGQDNNQPEFHRALVQMLADPNPLVQRNAALSLVRFKDDSGHAQIVSMLMPFPMQAPGGGILRQRLKVGSVVNPGTMVGHIDAGDRASDEVRAVVPGTLMSWEVPDKSQVTAGQTILLLSPNESMVWEALRALYLMGRTEDLPDVERYIRGADGMSPQIAQQAQSTARAIRDRASR